MTAAALDWLRAGGFLLTSPTDLGLPLRLEGLDPAPFRPRAMT